MKKTLLVVAVLFIVMGANAQIRWGIKAGGNLSKFTTAKEDGNKIDGQKAKFGFHLGGVMEYSINEMFAIQPELQFIMNGGKMEFDMGALGVSKTTTNINQLQLPVNAKIKFGTDNLKMFVMAGPYVGFGLSAKAKEDGADDDINLYKKEDGADKSAMKRFDFGINTAIGVEINSKITASVGYQYGLANLSNRDNAKIKMGTALLSVGYFF